MIPEKGIRTIIADKIRDHTTLSGTYTIQVITVEKYLTRVGLFIPEKKEVFFDPQVASNFQRGAIDIRSNPIKQRMLRDLILGGTLPPLVVYERSDYSKRWEIIDGLQRTHALTEALRALNSIERGEQPEDYVQTQIESIEEHHQQKPLTSDSFLQRTVTVQIWENLEPDELVHLFMILNVGQQKVSPRHLIEVTHAYLQDMFEQWGIRVLTEKEQRRIPRRGRRKSPEMMDVPSIMHFRFEFLIDGLIAYVTKDPQIKTKNILENRDSMNERLSENIAEIGNETSKADFRWICLNLNKHINQKYADEPKWRGIIQTSDNFFIPLMAALGEVRTSMGPHFAYEKRETELREILADTKVDDPFRFYSGSDSLEHKLNEVTSNIGRRRRAIIYFAWRSFFRDGISVSEYPLDWKGSALAQ